jgi:hypothetical protein
MIGRMIEVRPIRVRVRAPRIFAFQCLSTFDPSSPVWLRGSEPQVLSRDGDGLLVRFRHRTLGRVVPSVSRVRLDAPDRIVLEQLDGSLCSLRESLVLETEHGDATILVWSGEIEMRIPLAGSLIGRAIAARSLRDETRGTLERYRVTIEAAALATGLAEPAAGNGR